MSDITKKSLTEIINLIKKKEIKSEEVTKLFIDNINKDKKLNSFITKCNEEALDKAKNFDLLKSWRLKQERKLWTKTRNKKNLKIMSSEDLINFMQTYQRITQQMFKDGIKSSSIIMNLNTNHQIESLQFKTK